jgi:hypothetical protein
MSSDLRIWADEENRTNFDRRWQEKSISSATLYGVALKRHRCPLARAPCLNRSSVITSYILLSALFLFVSSEALRDVMQKEMKLRPDRPR